MRNRRVALACALKALMAPAYAASLLYLPQVMQKLFHFSPLETGLGMLPMLGGYAVVSFLVGSLSGRFSVHFGIVAGLAGLAIGPWLLSGFDAGAGYISLLAGMVVLGIGLGLFQPSVTTEAVEADDGGRKSLASGLVLMFQFVGGAIGLGLTTTIVAASERSAVNAHLAGSHADLVDAERSALGGLLSGTESARQVVQQFDQATAQALLETASTAFAAGVRTGLRVDAGIAAIGIALAALLLGSVRRDAQHRRSRPSPG
jgi:hypothetical protein